MSIFKYIVFWNGKKTMEMFNRYMQHSLIRILSTYQKGIKENVLSFIPHK